MRCVRLIRAFRRLRITRICLKDLAHFRAERTKQFEGSWCTEQVAILAIH